MLLPLFAGWCKSAGTRRASAPRLRGVVSLAVLTFALHAGADEAVQVTVSEARFHFLKGGTELPLRKVIGATLSVAMDDGSVRKIRIDGAEPDPRDAYGEVILYDFSVQEPKSTQWRPLCEPDPEQRRTGFPLAGSQVGGASRAGGFFVTCTGGAYGKCIRFGYRPWREKDGADLYQACVRMVRADYCGDGVGHTRNGTPINIYDPRGIQRRDQVAGMKFEAGWGPDGATCVNKTRLPELLTLEELHAACPRLAKPKGLRECNESAALAHGALILNESF